MLICRETRSPVDGDPEPADRAVLAYDDRYLRRKMLVCEGGVGFLVDLPDAVSLGHRDRLILDDGRHVEVIAAPEALMEVRGDLARLAWHIGNRHAPCQVERDRLVIRHDHVMADMLQRLGAEVQHVREPFTPEGGAYGHGRTHGHSHGHDAHADPNAHLHAHD